MSDHPRAGGRYFREADGSLTKAGKDGKHPAGDNSPAPPAGPAKAAAIEKQAAAQSSTTAAAPAGKADDKK